MKRKINGKINKTKKTVVTVIVVLLFMLFASSALVLSNRKYLFIEAGFREVGSVINGFFINHAYSSKIFKNNIESSKVNYLKRENNELRKSLALKEHNNDYVIGEVVNHAAQTFFNKIDINKGSKDNVEIDLPVINQDGLIGFISKTSKNVSEVKLLTSVNENNMLSVMIEDGDEQVAGVLSGYDATKKMFKVTDVMTKKDDLKDLNVVLSGYNNDSYKGIFVGKVADQEISNYGLSKTIWVKSEVNFDDVLFVAVVTNK